MLSTPKSKGELFLASSLRDGLEDNDLRQVKTLLRSKDADPNVLIPTHGITPFHLVIGNESEQFAEEVTKLFLRHGGNPNVRSSDGMTPVHVAAAWGRVGVLELLLANGGDPLRLDDDARSPFHYAFDGAFYDAIATLGKYCGSNSEDDDEMEPKYKLTLEKILINKGDCVAEYVPSEISSSVIAKSESIEISKPVKRESKKPPETTDNSGKDSNFSANSRITDEFASPLNTENVTLRRYQKLRGEASNVDASADNAFNEQCNAAEERLLVGRIIDRLSSTYVTDSSFVGNDAKTFDTKINKNDRTPKNSSTMKKNRSYLPAPKYHSHGLKINEDARKLFADNSIISKSPNFRVFGNEKISKRAKYDRSTEKNVKTGFNKYGNVGVKTPSKNFGGPENRVKSASSTPKKKLFSSRISGSVKLTRTEKSRFFGEKERRPVDRRIFDKTYCKASLGRFDRSSDDETSFENVDENFLTKNIAVKLDDRMYDDNLNDDAYEIPPKSKINPETTPKIFTRRLKPPQIFNNFKIERKPENTKISNLDRRETKIDCSTNLFRDDITKKKVLTLGQRSPIVGEEKNGKFETKREKIENCLDENLEKLKFIEDSPGSNHPVSVSRFGNSSGRKIEKNVSGSHDEDTKIWTEVDEACKNRCETPPASISFSDGDYSPNSSRETSEIAACTTFHSDYGSEDTCNSEYYENSTIRTVLMPNTKITASGSPLESFISVDEEYAYEDAEEGVAFIERRLCVVPSSTEEEKKDDKNGRSWIDRFDDLSLLTSDNSPSKSSQRSSPKSFLDDKHLRERLTALGENPGPITKTTFNVYLKRLYKLEREKKKIKKKFAISSPKENLDDKDDDQKISTIATYPNFLSATDWTEKSDYYRNLEERSFREYAIANPNRKYRGGISKTSFCYLLLDPRITEDLPRTGLRLSVEDRWSRFLRGIFYVGKGKAARPAAHLYDAFGIWSKGREIDGSSRKIRRILDIWRNGRGVVCLHVFSHTMVEEACSREAAMIDALETSHLTNCLRGTYYGYTTTMNAHEKRSLGKYLLYKAMEIFMYEGERQLFPRNVIL